MPVTPVALNVTVTSPVRKMSKKQSRKQSKQSQKAAKVEAKTRRASEAADAAAEKKAEKVFNLLLTRALLGPFLSRTPPYTTVHTPSGFYLVPLIFRTRIGAGNSILCPIHVS